LFYAAFRTAADLQVLDGSISPALEKQREKRRVVAIKTFGTAMETWLVNARLADSTRAMRKHIIDRDILPVFQNRLLTEIQAEDLRALRSKVKERGAPATAVQIRDIVKQVYVYAIAHGEKVDNPADSVGAASIATFVRRIAPCRRWKSDCLCNRWNRWRHSPRRYSIFHAIAGARYYGDSRADTKISLFWIISATAEMGFPVKLVRRFQEMCYFQRMLK